MKHDRKLWADTHKDQLPDWPCPTCGVGHLSVATQDIQIRETGLSIAEHDQEAWEPDWIQNRFMAFFECSLPSCREIAIVCGSAKVYHWQVGYDEYVTGNVFTVESISPAPIPIAIPAATPISIIDAVSRSASLIWPSPESAANQVRQAVECLMDDVGVPAKDPKGKTIFLHHRIVEFQKSDQDCGTILLATKWLGNIGSHVGTLERSDVLDAFEMFEYVLESQYGTAKAEILAKAAAINAAKGPTKIQ